MSEKIYAQQVANQEIMSEITSKEFAMEILSKVPEEQKKASYLPTLKKQLKEQDKKLSKARNDFEKAAKELKSYKSKVH